MTRKALALVGLGLAVFPVLVARALRPLVLVRFGWLRGDRIGHLATDTELYLCERDVGLQPARTLDIFYYTRPISNQQLKMMFDRTLNGFPVGGSIYKLNRMLPGGKKHSVTITGRDTYHSRDVLGLLARTPCHISFTPQEEELGSVALRELGVPEGAPFFCFAARDSAYLDAKFPPKEERAKEQAGWQYHDFRNTSVEDYLAAAEALADRGYAAIRVGDIVKEPLRNTDPRIIDYSSNGRRTDFLDIYLGAKCRFFMSPGTGIAAVPMIFRRPVAYVNYVPLEIAHTWGPDDLFIPKKLWLRDEGRLMAFREILESGVGRFIRTELYEQRSIEIMDNTPEEITAIAMEMDERLNGTWQTTEEDEELQQRFWTLFKGSELHGELVSRIGAQFLRENRELLD